MAKRRAASEPSLRVRDFLALVHEGVESRMGKKLGGMEMRQRFGYVQYWRGDSSIHYEVWVQKKTARLEIGLHFEGADRERNYAAAAMLADRAPEVVAAIGREYELEEWTALWTRLHRSFPAPVLTPDLATDAATRTVALIRGMEPILKSLRG